MKKLLCVLLTVTCMLCFSLPAFASSVGGTFNGSSWSGTNSIYDAGANAGTSYGDSATLYVYLTYKYTDEANSSIVTKSPSNHLYSTYVATSASRASGTGYRSYSAQSRHRIIIASGSVDQTTSVVYY